jgi:hypothetical protein
MTAYQLIPWDGAYGLFDWQHFTTIPNPHVGGQYGAFQGDDFLATYPGGEEHRFNRAGLLTSIEDSDGNDVDLVWSYNWTTRKYTLDRVAAAADGLNLSSGVADRELDFTDTGTTVRIDEKPAATFGRWTEFSRNASSDLTSVVPARRSAACAGTGKSGCLKFEYQAGHLLTKIHDPRRDPAGSTSGYTLQITWDPSSRATMVTPVVSSPTPAIEIVNYSITTSSGYRRVAWQDSNGTVATGSNEHVRFTEFGPNGSMKSEYAPRPCAGSNCTAVTAGDKLSDFQTDGIDNYTKEVAYRGAGNTLPVVSRRGTFASARVDNFADPIKAALTAWDQTPQQYQASVGAGNEDAYRTRHAYNALGLPTIDERPFRKVNANYSSVVIGTANLQGYWRLGDTSGTTTGDASGNGNYGTVLNGVLRGQPDALVDDTNSAMRFDGTDDRVSVSGLSIPQGAYTIEAWVNPDLEQTSRALAADWNGDGAMLYINSNGVFALAHSLDSANFVHSGVKHVPGRWDYVVGTWDGSQATVYVNGEPVASKAVTAAPGGGAIGFEVAAHTTGAAGTQFDGSVDEVAVYNRALTPAEVALHYAEGTAVFTQTTSTRYTGSHPVEVSDNLFLRFGGRARRRRQRLVGVGVGGREEHDDGPRGNGVGEADGHWGDRADCPTHARPDAPLPGLAQSGQRFDAAMGPLVLVEDTGSVGPGRWLERNPERDRLGSGELPGRAPGGPHPSRRGWAHRNRRPDQGQVQPPRRDRRRLRRRRGDLHRVPKGDVHQLRRPGGARRTAEIRDGRARPGHEDGLRAERGPPGDVPDGCHGKRGDRRLGLRPERDDHDNLRRLGPTADGDRP